MKITDQLLELYNVCVIAGLDLKLNLWTRDGDEFFSFSRLPGFKHQKTRTRSRRWRNYGRARNISQGCEVPLAMIQSGQILLSWKNLFLLLLPPPIYLSESVKMNLNPILNLILSLKKSANLSQNRPWNLKLNPFNLNFNPRLAWILHSIVWIVCLDFVRILHVQ